MQVRSVVLGVAALATTAALLPLGASAQADAARSDAARSDAAAGEYVVLYAGSDAATAEAARQAIARAGGTIVRENAAVGTALIRSTDANFASLVRRGDAVVGAARNRPVGHAPELVRARSVIERLTDADRAEAAERVRTGAIANPHSADPALVPAAATEVPLAEPLADKQWDMEMIGATPTGSYAIERGDERVLVGIMDTGVDGSHPDIEPNFDIGLSRNFAPDIPEADGPCETDTCIDPPDVDENGHGTHIAATIGAPINGIGIAGVAPEVTLVNVRAGQDSGFFFLQSVVDALTYSADAGLDVVNMSFYVDPWLYNCAANAADSPEDQAEQRTVIEAIQRAVDYARAGGVTPIGALGNESTDLGNPTTDDSSPNFPAGMAYERTVDNGCLDVPAETEGVISVASLGPSGRKAYYSNYGTEQTDFAAPGGDAFDTADNKVDPAAQVLAAYPEELGRATGDIDEAGEPTSPFVLKSCKATLCGYYQYLQGTSMAAPHAVGVAALVVSRYGLVNGAGEFGLDPAMTEMAMAMTAQREACPAPAEFSYTLEAASGAREFTHTCETEGTRNGFYGQGIVSAIGAANLLSLTDILAPPIG